MSEKQTKELLKKHEGFRLTIYNDTSIPPVLTGGYGHAFILGSKISKRVADALFEDDYEIARNDYHRFVQTFGISSLNSARECVLINMFYNMGYEKMTHSQRGFVKMIRALQNRDFQKAAIEMLDSSWAKQVGYRSSELSRIMSSGKFEE